MAFHVRGNHFVNHFVSAERPGWVAQIIIAVALRRLASIRTFSFGSSSEQVECHAKDAPSTLTLTVLTIALNTHQGVGHWLAISVLSLTLGKFRF